jgi:hypothetical protein
MSRERKRTSVEPEALEPMDKMARMSNVPKLVSALVIQASRTQIAEDKIEPRTVESSSGADVLEEEESAAQCFVESVE